LWVDHSLQVEQDFLATLSSQYDVGVHRQALLEDPKQGAQDINDWVSGATDGRITDLMGNRLDPDVAFVLVNALAFEGTWAGGSLEETASPVTFTCLDGHEVGVPFLRAQTGVYASTPAGQMTELAYDGGALRLKLFLPAEGTWDQARESILSGQLPIGDDELNSADVRLSFPAAELLPPTFDLTGNLQTMGLKAVFAPRGLLGIADDPSLVLSKVRQKALLRMDAKGTVATAATAASGTLMIGGPTQPVYLQLDRPFFLAIEDATGALLFIGQVVDPE